MEWLFSWEVTSWVIAIAVASAFTFIGFNDFKLARLFFLIGATDAAGGVIMWGMKTERPLWQLSLIAFLLLGSVGTLTVLALRYVDGKQHGGQPHTSPESGQLVCQVKIVQFEPVYRFYQSPPVFFQRLDTMIYVSLTNQTGKPLDIRDHSAAALVGTQWVSFKNAGSAAFEPYAFGLMGTKDGRLSQNPKTRQSES